MAGGRVKGITIDIDGNTTGLDKALSNVNKNAGKTNEELRDVNRLLKLDPGNVNLLAQKQKLLSQAVQASSNKLETLRSAESQVEKQFKNGDIGESQYRGFRREIEATEGQLGRLKTGLNNTESALKGDSHAASLVESGFNKASVKAKQLNSVANGQEIKRYGLSMSSLNIHARSTSGTLDTLKGKFGFGAVAGTASRIAETGMNALTGSVDDAISRVDTLNAFPKVLQNFGFSAKEAHGATDKMAKSIEGLPTTMDQAVSSVQGYVGATGNLNQSVDLFQATNDAAMVFAQGSSEAIDQFSMAYQQSLSAGKVEAENFNSMNESMPGLMNKVASEMGVSMSDLKDGLSDGSISIDDFNGAFKKLDTEGGAGMKSLSSSAKDSTGGIRTSMQNVKTEIVKALAGILDAVGSDNIKNMFKGLQNSIKGVVDFVKANKGWLVPLVGGIVGFIAALQVISGVISTVFLAIDVFTLAFTPLGLAIIAIIAVIALIIAAIMNWGKIVDWLKGIWGGIKDFFKGLWDGVVNIFKAAIQGIGDFLHSGFGQAILFIINPFAGLINFFVQNWDQIKQIFTNVVNAIGQFLSGAWNGMKDVASNVWNGIKKVSSMVWNGIKSVISNVVNGIKSNVSRVFNAVKSFVSKVWNGIKSVTSNVWNAIKKVVSTVVNNLKNNISNVFNAIKSVVSKVWNGVKNVTSNVWNGIKGVVSKVVNGIKGTISKVFGGLGNIARNGFNGIKNAASNVLNGVWDFIKGIVNKIKGAFNFHLSFPKISIPHIPLPHFSLSGDFNPLKGKIPHVGINWYAKGGIFNKPTLFAGNGGFNGVGEAGPEAALPLNAKTLGGIGKGIAENMELSGSGQPIININVYTDLSDAGMKKITGAVQLGLARAARNKNMSRGGR